VSGTARIVGAAQPIPVSDLAASEVFHAGTLGCHVKVRSDEHQFVTVRREGLMLGLKSSFGPEAVRITGEMMATQAWVDDLAALWDELGTGLQTLPEGRVRPPFRQPCGVREFHVKDPDGFLMHFAEAAEAGIA